MNKYIKLASLLGLGLTASIAAFASPWGHNYHYGHDKAKIEIFMELPVEKQTLILHTMKQVHDENDDLINEITETRESLISILTAPQFSENEFKAEAEKLEAQMTQGLRVLTSTITNLAPQLTQEERMAIVQMSHHRTAYHDSNIAK